MTERVRRVPFEYAIVRVVPRVERGERFNAGVILFSRPRRFLGAKTHLDTRVLSVLAPGCDSEEVRAHLAAIEQIARGLAGPDHDDGGTGGDARGGGDGAPIAAMSLAERFHWLVGLTSTIVQPSEVHTGLTGDPSATLDHLFETLVLGRD